MKKGIFSHTGVHHITLERVSKTRLRAFIYGQALSNLLPPDWKNENWKKEFKNYLMRGNNLTNIPTQNKRWKSESVTQGLDSPGIEY